MNCLGCHNLDLKTFPKHSRVGMGKCAREKEAGVFVNFSRSRECAMFRAAPADIVLARKEWVEKS